MKLLEVEGARAPVPHSWRRHCLPAWKLRVPECQLFEHSFIIILCKLATMLKWWIRPDVLLYVHMQCLLVFTEVSFNLLYPQFYVNLPYRGKALNSLICADVPLRNCSLT